MFAGTRTLASVVAVFAALSLAVFQAAGVAINRDGSVHAAQNVADMTKELFLKYLDTKQSMLISFYGADSKESDKALSDFDEFARKAVKRYPDLQLGKVDFKQSPYLTARMLLTGIPELRLLVKEQDSTWRAYNVEIPFDADEMVRYIDNQLWLDEAALGGKAQMYCSPFNFCGKALAFIADKSSAVEDVLPIPKWLALILIPAIITFAGRFIIDGMYGAEEWIRNFLGRPQTAKACDEPDLDSDPDEEEEEEHSAGRFKTPKKKTQ